MTCSICGRPSGDEDRNIRFRLPDPVLTRADQEHAPGTWLSNPDPNLANLMQVDHVGPFARALLRVPFEGATGITYGVWVTIHPDDLRRLFYIWREPEYADFRCDGLLGNSLPGWDGLGRPVTIAVVDPDQVPVCVASPDPALHDAMTREWPHDHPAWSTAPAM